MIDYIATDGKVTAGRISRACGHYDPSTPLQAHRIASCVGDRHRYVVRDQELGLIAFCAWQDSAQFVPIASEGLVHSLEHRYASTTDLICTIRSGKLALLDIKAWRGVYTEYQLQLAARAYACGEMTGRIPGICMNLHVRSDSTFTEANTFAATELLFQTFRAAKRLFEWISAQPASNERVPQRTDQKVAPAAQP
jgi:hypothetical protein